MRLIILLNCHCGHLKTATRYHHLWALHYHRKTKKLNHHQNHQHPHHTTTTTTTTNTPTNTTTNTPTSTTIVHFFRDFSKKYWRFNRGFLWTNVNSYTLNSTTHFVCFHFSYNNGFEYILYFTNLTN
jgi:hypothetical protein